MVSKVIIFFLILVISGTFAATIGNRNFYNTDQTSEIGDEVEYVFVFDDFNGTTEKVTKDRNGDAEKIETVKNNESESSEKSLCIGSVTMMAMCY